MDKCIAGFLGGYSLLNPAYLEPCTYDGDVYPTIIMAVEASKFQIGRASCRERVSS